MKSDIPNSSQFSPTQTPLPRLLAVVRANQPNRQAIAEAIFKEFFADRVGKKLENNTIFALSDYGLLDKPREDQAHASLTGLGEALAALAAGHQEAELYGSFVRHILLNRRGLDVVACIQDIVTGGYQPTKALITKELGRRGIYHSPNGTHLNGMRQWFEAAGLVAKDGWVPREDRLKEILGVDTATLEAYAELTQEQRDFAKAFGRLNVAAAWSNDVADYAMRLFGTEFPEGRLPHSVLFALRDAGLIECEKVTTGHGTKPYWVRPTDKLRNEMIEPILNTIERSTSLRYRMAFRLGLPELALSLRVEEPRVVRGNALEALAIHLAGELGLQPTERRTGSDGRVHLALVSRSRRDPIRWQVLCKGSHNITMDDVAISAGLASTARPTFVLLLTTGRLDKEAQQFTTEVSYAMGLRHLTLDRYALAKLASAPSVTSLIWSTPKWLQGDTRSEHRLLNFSNPG